MDTKVALFIDCENVSSKYIDDIMNELATYGEVNIRKAYGDWESRVLSSWKKIRFEYGLESILQPPYSSSKNATDIKMTVDIMNIVHRDNNIKHIALATSDSDFTPLVNEIKANGIQVIGFGEPKTSDVLRSSCSQFSELKPLIKLNNIESNKLLVGILKDAVYHCSYDDSGANVAQIGNFLKNRNAQQAKNFGEYKSWGEIFKALNDIFEISYSSDGTIMMVKLIK